MNELIETIFQNFTVEEETIPVSFLFYEGHGEPYVTYMQETADGSFSGDDELLGYVDYYDFDVYSTGNLTKIIEGVKELLKANDFEWQPSRTSQDFFDKDTGYFHKTLSFAIPREV